MKVPYFLAAMGYHAPDPAKPRELENRDGHPFHPISLKGDIDPTEGECIRLVAEASFNASTHDIAYQLAKRVCNCFDVQRRDSDHPSRADLILESVQEEVEDELQMARK